MTAIAHKRSLWFGPECLSPSNLKLRSVCVSSFLLFPAVSVSLSPLSVSLPHSQRTQQTRHQPLNFCPDRYAVPSQEAFVDSHNSPRSTHHTGHTHANIHREEPAVAQTTCSQIFMRIAQKLQSKYVWWTPGIKSGLWSRGRDVTTLIFTEPHPVKWLWLFLFVFLCFFARSLIKKPLNAYSTSWVNLIAIKASGYNLSVQILTPAVTALTANKAFPVPVKLQPLSISICRDNKHGVKRPIQT